MTELEIKLLDALRETAQTLSWISFGECRGISENLLTPKQAVDVAKSAIAAAEDAQPDEAQRAVEAEREACVKTCEDLTVPTRIDDPLGSWVIGTLDCANAIRARGNKH